MATEGTEAVVAAEAVKAAVATTIVAVIGKIMVYWNRILNCLVASFQLQ